MHVSESRSCVSFEWRQPLNITAVWTSIFVVLTWGNIGPCKQVKHTWWTTIVGYMLVQISRMIQKHHVCCFACGCRSSISIHDQWWITGETGETQRWWRDFHSRKKGADVWHVAWEILWEQIVCKFQGFLTILPILHERSGSVSTFCHANYLRNWHVTGNFQGLDLSELP